MIWDTPIGANVTFKLQVERHLKKGKPKWVSKSLNLPEGLQPIDFRQPYRISPNFVKILQFSPSNPIAPDLPTRSELFTTLRFLFLKFFLHFFQISNVPPLAGCLWLVSKKTRLQVLPEQALGKVAKTVACSLRRIPTAIAHRRSCFSNSRRLLSLRYCAVSELWTKASIVNFLMSQFLTQLRFCQYPLSLFFFAAERKQENGLSGPYLLYYPALYVSWVSGALINPHMHFSHPCHHQPLTHASAQGVERKIEKRRRCDVTS